MCEPRPQMKFRCFWTLTRDMKDENEIKCSFINGCVNDSYRWYRIKIRITRSSGMQKENDNKLTQRVLGSRSNGKLHKRRVSRKHWDNICVASVYDLLLHARIVSILVSRVESWLVKTSLVSRMSSCFCLRCYIVELVSPKTCVSFDNNLKVNEKKNWMKFCNFEKWTILVCSTFLSLCLSNYYHFFTFINLGEIRKFLLCHNLS